MMTLQEKLAQAAGVQKSNENKNVWEQLSVRSLNPVELEKIDCIKVIRDHFSEKFYGQIVFKDGSSYPKPIQFEKTSIVTLGELIPLHEIRWVHYHYNGDDPKITTKDILKFRVVKEFSFDNPLGL